MTGTYVAFRVEKFGEPLQAKDVETVKPEGKQVVVKTTRCGVCHSDLHVGDGYYDFGKGNKMSMADRGLKPPLVMGHEIVGTLLEVGPDAKADHLEKGKNYVVFPWIGCGECSVCKAGQENNCPKPQALGIHLQGGYAEHVTVPDPKFLIDIGDLNPSEAATLACSGLTAYSALNKTWKYFDQPLVIIGMGGVGTSCLIVAKAMGFKNIVAVDISDEKLENAKKLGASQTFNSKSDSIIKDLAALDNGIGATSIIDFVGSEDTAKIATTALAKGGRYVLVGLFGGGIELGLPQLPLRNMSMIGSYTGNLKELHELMELARAGKLEHIPVEEIEPSEESVNQALDRLRNGKAPKRQILKFH